MIIMRVTYRDKMPYSPPEVEAFRLSTPLLQVLGDSSLPSDIEGDFDGFEEQGDL